MFSFWQIRTFHEHNRLSVRPRMVLWLDSSTELHGANMTTVVAKNLGLGPAYVTKIEYQFKGLPVDVHDPAAVKKVMDAAFGDRWVKASPLVALTCSNCSISIQVCPLERSSLTNSTFTLAQTEALSRTSRSQGRYGEAR